MQYIYIVYTYERCSLMMTQSDGGRKRDIHTHIHVYRERETEISVGRSGGWRTDSGRRADGRRTADRGRTDGKRTVDGGRTDSGARAGGGRTAGGRWTAGGRRIDSRWQTGVCPPLFFFEVRPELANIVHMAVLCMASAQVPLCCFS